MSILMNGRKSSAAAERKALQSLTDGQRAAVALMDPLAEAGLRPDMIMAMIETSQAALIGDDEPMKLSVERCDIHVQGWDAVDFESTRRAFGGERLPVRTETITAFKVSFGVEDGEEEDTVDLEFVAEEVEYTLRPMFAANSYIPNAMVEARLAALVAAIQKIPETEQPHFMWIVPGEFASSVSGNVGIKGRIHFAPDTEVLSEKLSVPAPVRSTVNVDDIVDAAPTVGEEAANALIEKLNEIDAITA